MTLRSRSAALLLALVVGPVTETAALVPGGGSKKSDCYAEWLVTTDTRTPSSGVTKVDCEDGDPTCDVDATMDGVCTFGVSICVPFVANVTGCTPQTVTQISLNKKSQKAGFQLPPLPASASVCGPATLVSLALKSTKSGQKPSKKAVFQMKARADVKPKAGPGQAHSPVRAERRGRAVPGQSERRRARRADDGAGQRDGPRQRVDRHLPQLPGGTRGDDPDVSSGLRRDRELPVHRGRNVDRADERSVLRCSHSAPRGGCSRLPRQPLRITETHRRGGRSPDRRDRGQPQSALVRLSELRNTALPALLGKRRRENRDVRQWPATGTSLPDRWRRHREQRARQHPFSPPRPTACRRGPRPAC